MVGKTQVQIELDCLMQPFRNNIVFALVEDEKSI